MQGTNNKIDKHILNCRFRLKAESGRGTLAESGLELKAVEVLCRKSEADCRKRPWAGIGKWLKAESGRGW
ncbi:MAG: hypothetical protein GQ575_02770 [Deltaproteobacteria bacterium]|nr:hypothetical protein [Deltaproteobacteria bacterium]